MCFKEKSSRSMDLFHAPRAEKNHRFVSGFGKEIA